MKKFSFIAFIAVVVSTLGFADDAAKPAGPEFKFGGAVQAYTTRIATTEKDQTADYSAFRFRPYFSVKSENVEAAVKFEIDSFMGKSKSGSEESDVGYDEKDQMEVKAAYVKFKVPAVSGLSIKAGADSFSTIGDWVLATEIAGGTLNYKAGMFDITLLNGKVEEKDLMELNDDVDFYAADAKIKLSDAMTVRPALYVQQYGKDAGDTNAYIMGLGFAGSFGAISIDAAFNYGMASGRMWEDEFDINGNADDTDIVETDATGYALDIAPSFEVNENLSIGAFFTMLSGDDGKVEGDGTGAQEFSGFAPMFAMKDDWGRMFILEDAAEFSNIGETGFADVRMNPYGYMLVGLTAEYNMKPFSIGLAAAWGQLAAEQDGDDEFETALGTEIDATVSYEIEKNAKVVLEVGYLLAGDAFKSGTESPENASQVALGMMYKW